MIIADTSVWIEYFKKTAPFFDILALHIEANKILAHEMVFAELLQGVRFGREDLIIEGFWNNLPQVSIDDMAIMAGKYSATNKLRDQGLGLIDAMIVVSAIETRSRVWTLDKKLARVVPQELLFAIGSD